MTKKYLIKFTPLGHYFFGGNKSFSEGNQVQSLLFPPASTILGCLRYNILKEKASEVFIINGAGKEYPDFIKNKNKIEALTGSSQFKSYFDEDDNLGTIKSVSPVFLVDGENVLYKVPADIEWKNKNNRDDGLKYIEHTETTEVYTGKGKLGFISKRDIKSPDVNYYGDAEFWQNYLSHTNLVYNKNYNEKEIFHSGTRPGIALNNKTTIEGAFYNKTSYSLRKEVSFAIILHTSDCEKLLPDEKDVYLGGERSLFRMNTVLLDDQKHQNIYNHPVTKKFCNPVINQEINGSSKVIALSDLLTENPITGFIHSIVKGNKSIKHLTSDWKSPSYNLYPAGSVFYVKEKIDFETGKYLLAEKSGLNRITGIK